MRLFCEDHELCVATPGIQDQSVSFALLLRPQPARLWSV